MTDQIAPSRAEALQAMLATSPMVLKLGMRCDVLGDEMTGVLPFQKQLIGNRTIQALHGGAIATFLEVTAAAQLYLSSEVTAMPKTINLTVDYLRQGHAKDLYARADIVKLGRRMASVRAVAWQDEKAKPVTALVAHFMVS